MALSARQGLARALGVVMLGHAALADSTFHPDVGSHCTTDASCRSIMMVCIEGYCDHKQLFPLEFQDYLTTGLIFVAVSISSACGNGGGGIMIPLLILISQFPEHSAIPLVSSAIFGASIANFLFLSQRNHPIVPFRHLIDYDTALVMEPITLAGTVAGVYANKILPNYLISVMIVIVLFWSAYRCYKKSVQIRELEDIREERLRAEKGSVQGGSAAVAVTFKTDGDDGGTEDEQRGLLGNCDVGGGTLSDAEIKSAANSDNEEASGRNSPVPTAHHDTLSGTKAQNEDTKSQSKKRVMLRRRKSMARRQKKAKDLIKQMNPVQSWLLPPMFRVSLPEVKGGKVSSKSRRQRFYEQEVQFPTGKMLLLFVAWLLLLILALFKGGEGTDSVIGLECGSLDYWVVVASIFPIFIVGTCIVWLHLADKSYKMVEMGCTFVAGDVNWNHPGTRLYPAMCLWAGFACAMLGVSGDTVKAPILLEMEMLPEVVAATASFMTLFTSSSIMSQFLILGNLRPDYGLWYGFAGFLSAMNGQTFVRGIFARQKRTSVIALLLACVILTSGIMMGIAGIVGFEVEGLVDFNMHICT